MPLQNRVLPTGKIVADSARGTIMGNRGIIHKSNQTLGKSRWSHHAWICCSLEWKGRKRQVMTGRKWTELFFLDEATALAAGHRPCGYCRRESYNAFVDAWEASTGVRPTAKQMDHVLHPARVQRDRTQVRFESKLGALPNGVFVFLGSNETTTPYLKWNETLLPYSPHGYGNPMKSHCQPETKVVVLTPKPIVNVFAAGYEPLVFLEQQQQQQVPKITG